MEATFDINEDVMECLREEADRCGITMSALVESALRMALPQGKLPSPEPLPAKAERAPLPTWRAEFLVDVSNREELYRVLDEAEDSKVRRGYGWFQPGRAPEEKE